MSAKTKKRARAGRKRSRRKPGQRRLWLRVLLVLVPLIVAGLAWLIWPFWQLSGQFGTTPAVHPSRLYGRPLVLERGTALSVKELSQHLKRLEYHQVSSAEGLVPGSYLVDGSRLRVFRRTFLTPEGPVGHNLLEVEIAAVRVRRLQVDGREVRLAYLDPPLIASYYGDDLMERRPIGLDELPEDLILAVLAIEDSKFLEHSGVSPLGILRAAWVNFRAQGVRQGGSTLTQQLVKNIYLTHERTLLRKVQEALLAVMLELRYEKRDILQAYLNEIYWGRSGNVQLMGVGAAAWAYFAKAPAQLSLAESALLAGMIQAPAVLSPLAQPDRSVERRNQVLTRLAELEWVQSGRLEQAAQEALSLRSRPLVARSAAYFAEAIVQEARHRFAIEELRDQGYTLLSTLDVEDQEEAEEAVAWGLKALEEGWEKGAKRRGPLEAALVSVDPRSGAILSYVGGRDYGKSQFDRVAKARRQAGSAFKPIVFAAAFLARQASPSTFLRDQPFSVQLAGQRWSPQNSDGQYSGVVTAREAVERSLNVPTARLAMEMGLEPVAALAQKMGVARTLQALPALALGAMEVTPLELATVYATLAAEGMRPELHGLRAVWDRDGKKVPGRPVAEPRQALPTEVAYLVTDVLRGVMDRGTARIVRSQGLTDPLAGKTGTTNDRRDSWFAGYSRERASLVWVGYDDNSRTRLSGARAALPIWARYVAAVRPRGGYTAHAPPRGVVQVWIDPQTGGLATDHCPEPQRELFLLDAAPRALCPDHGRWRGRPLEQPPGFETDRQHPFKRWLKRIRGKDRRDRDDG